MFALGARAHKLVRSTTAILDGPMGGKQSLSTIDDDNVIIEGADGFDGLEVAINNIKNESSIFAFVQSFCHKFYIQMASCFHELI